MKTNKLRINTAAPLKPEGSVLIIYTGGTIGMIMDKDNTLLTFDFKGILERVPVLKTFNLQLEVISFEEPLDSSNMQPEHWVEIANIIEEHYADHDGFVVLQGTDTMAYTASALSFMLKGLSKPVIFTGSQLPIFSPRSDAHENLITSIEIASRKENGLAIVPEVCIYFDYLLMRGNRTKKVESQHFDAFKSENYPPLAEAGISIEFNRNYILQPDPAAGLSVFTRLDTSVVIIKLFPGLSWEIVQRILETEGLKGVVLETFGAGNAPSDPKLLTLLQEAIRRGIIVMNVSQCAGGRVLQGRYETSRQLVKIGVISGKDITTEAAVVKLMFVLGMDVKDADRVALLGKAICGELDD